MMVARVAMFASSYIPLYLLLVVKYAVDGFFGETAWCLFGTVMAVLLGVCCILLALFLWLTAEKAHAQAVEESAVGRECSAYYVKSITGSTTPELLNYLAVYFMPCLNMSIARASDTLVMLAVMVVVGIIYLKERATYLNPLLLLLGYRSYGCVVGEVRVGAGGVAGAVGELQNEILMRKSADSVIAGKSYGGKRFGDFIMLSE